jgi:cyclopropane fatty-acyl-phospholipid synthase-like methyltransferase
MPNLNIRFDIMLAPLSLNAIMITPKLLVDFLKAYTPKEASWLNRMKIQYRPYICPLDELLNELPEGATVFDYGCGNGAFLALAAHFKKATQIGGLEISETLVKNARELLQAQATKAVVNVDTFDGKNIPDTISDYEYVFMTDVFHHIPVDIRIKVLSDLCMKMKSGSKLIMKDIDAASPLVVMNKLHDRVAAGEIGNEISLKKMMEVLKEAGFQIQSHRTKRMLWYPHYTVVCNK